ncbi:Kinase [Aphelenchoides besseyi]|nr:Kinase [Aphelenchoides besseyi]
MAALVDRRSLFQWFPVHLEMIETDDDLPPPYVWFEHQIAGHHPSVVKNGLRQIGIIKKPNTNVLLKVVQDGVRGQCEEHLYTDIVEAYENGRKDLTALYNLYSLVPRFYGTHKIEIGKRKKEYKFLELEDVVFSYHRPCVMDVKIGRVTYDPTASEEKQLAELAKSPFQQICGFRILGYRISTFDNPRIKGKEWGRDQTAETVDDAFAEFLEGRPGCFHELTKEFLRRIRIVENYFNDQQSLQFYASSLLFVYEADPEHDLNVDLRMIDFSHVFRDQSVRDENYIVGVRYISDIFNRLIDRQ